MANAPEYDILQNLQEALEGINDQDGYKTTAVTVEAVVKSWASVAETERPWIGYFAMPRTYTHRPCNVMRVQLPVFIAAHVSGSTKEGAQLAILNLTDDIIKAVSEDITRDGKAIQTTIRRVTDDHGDPDVVDRQGASGTLTMELEILYDRDTQGS